MTPPDVMIEQRIRQRAYEIYLARIANPALADWLQAEREILEELGRAGVNRPLSPTPAT
jgi:hypothetical protein